MFSLGGAKKNTDWRCFSYGFGLFLRYNQSYGKNPTVIMPTVCCTPKFTIVFWDLGQKLILNVGVFQMVFGLFICFFRVQIPPFFEVKFVLFPFCASWMKSDWIKAKPL
jgi:hypothetical protein